MQEQNIFFVVYLAGFFFLFFFFASVTGSQTVWSIPK